MDKEISEKKAQLEELVARYKDDPRCRQKSLRFGPEKPSMQYYDAASNELLDLKIATFKRLLDTGEHISENDHNFEILEGIFKAKGSQFLACDESFGIERNEKCRFTLTPLDLEAFDYDTFGSQLDAAFEEANGHTLVAAPQTEDASEAHKKWYSMSFTLALHIPLPPHLSEEEKNQHLSGDWITSQYHTLFEHMYRKVLARYVKRYAWLYDAQVKQCFTALDHAALEVVFYEGSSWEEQNQ